MPTSGGMHPALMHSPWCATTLSRVASAVAAFSCTLALPVFSSATIGPMLPFATIAAW